MTKVQHKTKLQKCFLKNMTLSAMAQKLEDLHKMAKKYFAKLK